MLMNSCVLSVILSLQIPDVLAKATGSTGDPDGVSICILVADAVSKRLPAFFVVRISFNQAAAPKFQQ